jgi:hypothetical protein
VARDHSFARNVAQREDKHCAKNSIDRNLGLQLFALEAPHDAQRASPRTRAGTRRNDATSLYDARICCAFELRDSLMLSAGASGLRPLVYPSAETTYCQTYC